MATFLQNGASQRQLGTKDLSLEAFDLSVAEFIEKFTNYGCYCWILGPEKGVIGGGQTRDQIDGLCGQLYKCYKCLNLDYGNDQSKFDYDVSLIVGDDGSRKLECHEGTLTPISEDSRKKNEIHHTEKGDLRPSPHPGSPHI